MSVTGIADGEPGAGPVKVGVAVSDLMAGMYAATAILGALYERAAQWRRAVHRPGAAGHPARLARQPEPELPAERSAAGPSRFGASEHRPVPGVRHARWLPYARGGQRPAVRKLLPRGWGWRSSRAMRASPTTRSASRIARARRAPRGAVRHPLDRASGCASSRRPRCRAAPSTTSRRRSRSRRCATAACAWICRIALGAAGPGRAQPGALLAQRARVSAAHRRRSDSTPRRCSRERLGLTAAELAQLRGAAHWAKCPHERAGPRATAAGVCELRLNRPEKRNAITFAMYAALLQGADRRAGGCGGAGGAAERGGRRVLCRQRPARFSQRARVQPPSTR